MGSSEDTQKILILKYLAGFIGILLAFFISASCNLLTRMADPADSTRSAIEAQQTILAQTSTAMGRMTSQPIPATPTPPAGISPTVAPGDLTQTVSPLTTASTSETPLSAVQNPDERLMKSAKILLFEDMSASRHIRYVQEALDRAGYFYLDVGSAKGWFKSQLISSEEWDLIIAAAEARRDFGGEFFVYINNRVKHGSGAVIEYWDMDSAPEGQIKPLLDQCGIEFFSDWFEPELRVFYWLDPANPVLHEPNSIQSQLSNAPTLWNGDVGDMLAVADPDSGEAQLLAGTNPIWPNDHGTLVNCVDGRVIIQTFSSHEYARDDVVPLWQNYIYQTLKNHFAYVQRIPPTPAVTAVPESTDAVTPSGPTPGPAYLHDHPCGGIFSARLLDAPRFQQDLFEHHAAGTFLILRLQLANQTDYDFQIWDEDYYVEATLDGRSVVYPPHKAATGYLYIERPTNLYQDVITSGENWHTGLVFDVDPDAKDLVLVVKPGSEFDEQVCEARIPLTR
jgi:hypothetical protein